MKRMRPDPGASLGHVASLALAGVGVAYVLVLAVGVARHGLDEPIADPVLAIMEALTLLSAPVIVVLLAAIHARAGPERKVFGVCALAFGTLFAGLTCAVHFTELTAVRQSGGGGLAWPSRAYAVELLAWDLFLGLALLFASRAFSGEGASRGVRRALTACGALCVLGTLGPSTGDMRLQWLGVLGYAVLLPVAALLLALFFARRSG